MDGQGIIVLPGRLSYSLTIIVLCRDYRTLVGIIVLSTISLALVRHERQTGNEL